MKIKECFHPGYPLNQIHFGKSQAATPKKDQGFVRLVRKSVVSKVCTQKPEFGKELADLMCHSEDTSKRPYLFQNKKQKGGLVRVLFFEVFCEKMGN